MDVRIIPYESRYQRDFKTLNEEWIVSYFEMEEEDHKTLDNPEEYILQKGGFIFVALYNGEVVGVCALLKDARGHYDYELAKLAVNPKYRGKKTGFLLVQSVINKAKELGASKIFLESNTLLEPAIHLYRKFGFKEVTGYSSPYKRVDIIMELIIT